MSRGLRRRNGFNIISQPAGSTVDAIYKVLKQKKIVTIASVLFESHTILEPNYNKESDGRRNQ